MPRKIDNTQPAVSGVTAGEQFTGRIIPGNRIHAIVMEHSGFTDAQLTNLGLYLNGHRYWDLPDLGWMTTLNAHDGLTNNSGITMLYFDSMGLKSQRAQELTALDAGPGSGIDDIAIVGDIAGAASSPSIKFHTIESQSIGADFVFRAFRRYQMNPTGASLQTFDKFPKGPIVRKMMIKEDSTVMTEVEVVRDKVSLFKRTPARNNALLDDGVRVPQTDHFAVDFSQDGDGANALETVDNSGRPFLDIKADITVSGAAQLDIILEEITGLER